MKTAEEWIDSQRNKIYVECPARIKGMIEVLATDELIKQIQLDAAKWGAEQAAKHISLLTAGSSVSDSYNTAITFANNLTIDQLPK